MIKFLLKYTDKNNVEQSVLVNNSNQIMEFITNSDIDKYVIEKFVIPEPNFDLVKSVIDHVEKTGMVKSITSITVVDSNTILVADYNHYFGNGIVFLLKYNSVQLQWETEGVLQPQETGPVHFGKSIRLDNSGEIRIESDINITPYLFD
jgi:hypothetical protein